MKTCKLCGITHADVRTYEDNINKSDINLCFICLAKVHYCNVCNHLTISSVPYKDKRICPTCAESKDLKVCKFCGKLETKALSKEGACPTCVSLLTLCSGCGKHHLKDTLESTKDGKILCMKCISVQGYQICPCCSICTPASAFDTDKGFCKDCLKESRNCCICNAATFPKKTDIYKVGKELYACANCVTSNPCSSCCKESGTYKNVSLSIEGSDRNIYVCHTCYITNNYGVIKGYSYKPTGKFKTVNSAEYPTLYLGIENEVNFKSGMNPQERVRILFDRKEDHWYIKRDGSVSNGFEIVTHPMQFEYFKTEFPLSKLFPEDFGIIKSGECGMHIHLSKDAFTNAHLFKFMQFFVNCPEFCEKIAERKANSYCSKLGKWEVVEKAVRKSGGARNQVNLGPAYTVEVRAFAGARTEEQYRKNVEFVYALFSFTKLYSIINLTEEKFKEFLLKDILKYSNLVKFLELAI